MKEQTRDVILLRTIEDGKLVKGKMVLRRFKPAPLGVRRVTKLPISLFEQLRGKNPPVFVDIEEIEKEEVDAGEEIVVKSPKAQKEDKRSMEELDAGTEVTVLDEDEDFPGEDDPELEGADEESPAVMEEGEDPEPYEAQGGEDGAHDVLVQTISEIPHVSDAVANALVEAGFTTFGDIAFADNASLIEIPGIGPGNVARIKAAAQAMSED